MLSRTWHWSVPPLDSFQLNESDLGTLTTAEQDTKLVTHLLDDHHSELYGEREQFLRPPFFQQCVNGFEKTRESPSAMVGSNSEHEELRSRSNSDESAKTPPTEFYIGSPRSSCADEEVASSGRSTGASTLCSESLVVPNGGTKRRRWKSRGGRRGRRQRQLFRKHVSRKTANKVKEN